MAPVPFDTAGYDAYEKWGTTPSATQRERIAATLALVPDDVGTVLDVGCGDGVVSNCLVQRGVEVTAVDVSRSALAHVCGYRVVASAAQLPFRERAFDLALCTEVLEHLPEAVYARTRAELDRVARRYVLVATPNEEHLPDRHVKCAQCGWVYHRGYHCRSFDHAAHACLFPGLEAVRNVAIGQRSSRPARTWLEQHLLGQYRTGGLPCPRCGCARTACPSRSGARRVAAPLVQLVAKLARPRRTARWLATLFRRR